MSGSTSRIIVVAYAHAQLTAYLVRGSTGEWARLQALLEHLRALGRVAWYTSQLPPAWSVMDRTVDAIAGAVGRFTVDAALASPPTTPGPAPAWLLPLWAFDHQIAGRPASTADFVGLPLKVVATPADDDEDGAYLPGWPGRWWITATTMGASP